MVKISPQSIITLFIKKTIIEDNTTVLGNGTHLLECDKRVPGTPSRIFSEKSRIRPSENTPPLMGQPRPSNETSGKRRT